MKKKAFAIVRLDLPVDTSEIQNYVTIKEVVWTLEKAVAEVARLTKLNAGKNCVYFYQYTRVEAE